MNVATDPRRFCLECGDPLPYGAKLYCPASVKDCAHRADLRQRMERKRGTRYVPPPAPSVDDLLKQGYVAYCTRFQCSKPSRSTKPACKCGYRMADLRTGRYVDAEDEELYREEITA